ncbi:nitrate- and nitrite sensing domain-containing protein [Streptomyces sp. NPDC047017]|uniref:sensor histidine kinase n=1 Tax=Streptomyces sp. NPDC047017 TaxID=3155024 RepID=UPI0033CDEA1F
MLPFVIPAVCVCGLWGYTAAGLVDDQIRSHSAAAHVTDLARPAQELLTRLQNERRLTALWQASRTDAARADLDSARARTDDALAAYRRQAAGPGTAELRRRTGALDGALAPLAERRTAIDARKLSSDAAFTYFTDATDQELALLASAVRGDDAGAQRAGSATATLARITEMLSREDALLSAALPGRRMPAADRARFGQYLAVQQADRAGLTGQDLPGNGAAAYSRALAGARWTTVDAVQQSVAGNQSDTLPSGVASWPAAATGIVGGFQTQGDDALTSLADHADDRAGHLLLAALLGSAVALALLAAAAVPALRTRRSALARLTELDRLSEALTGLCVDTEQLAAFRLPQTLARMEKGERTDPAGLAPRHAKAGDGIGRLATAIDRLARTAADSALRQSQGRAGSDKVVGQLIRRAQVLIHRLIALLDDLERKHEDSDLLKDIFRVDHLATRVRRHAENLMILSGAPPSRRMARPVALTDVMRGAVAETEQYTRVRVKNTPADRRVALAGRAVADVTHLLAELIENGTSFSPPDTQVTVGVTRVAKGLAVHVEDQGLGMPADLLARANAVLAEPPRVDMTVFGEDPRLGHFVVARLAERHGIRVVLRESDYGGTLALVMLPAQLLENASSPVVDQLQSAAVAAGRAAADPAEAELTGTGQHRAVPGPHALAGAGAPAAADEAIVHTALPDQHAFPEYGGAGLLPPASPHPAHPAAEPAATAPDLAPPSPPAAPAAPPTAPGAAESALADFGQPQPRPRPQPPFQDGHPGHPGLRDYPGPPVIPGEPSGPAAPVAMPATAAQAPPPAPAPFAPDAPPPLTTPSVLPQRVRGASLAQQLRREAAHAEDEPAGGSDHDVISPHASARAMSAIHQGLKRAWTAEDAEDTEDDDTPHDAHGRPNDAAGPTAHEL